MHKWKDQTRIIAYAVKFLHLRMCVCVPMRFQWVSLLQLRKFLIQGILIDVTVNSVAEKASFSKNFTEKQEPCQSL